MGSVLAGVTATFVTIPVLSFLISYMILRKVTKNKRKSFHISTDIMTLFLILSVNYLTLVIWEKSFLWLIALLLLVIAMITVFLQWKVQQDVQLKKVVKGFWRISFLLFFVGHIGLTVYGLVFRIYSL
ncbi:Ca2+/Na+ antiporter [Bacillus fengqiuensis]|nr:Ca2+/Na+ antiporter [Bacillus fengqiuensis]